MSLPAKVEEKEKKQVKGRNNCDEVSVIRCDIIFRVISDGRFNKISREWRSVVAHTWSTPINVDSDSSSKRKYKEKPHYSSKELYVKIGSQAKILQLLCVSEQI